MHIYHGRRRVADEEGFEAVDLTTAQTEARRLVRALIADQVDQGLGVDSQYVELRDELDQVRDVISFRDVLYES